MERGKGRVSERSEVGRRYAKILGGFARRARRWYRDGKTSDLGARCIWFVSWLTTY